MSSTSTGGPRALAARLYYAAFKLDPSKSGRKMVAWLRSRSGGAPTPMEMETVSAGVSEPPGKKRCRWHRGDRPGGGDGGRILENPHQRFIVHRVTRPLRGSVSCGSGWSVPCVSIQLTLSQRNRVIDAAVLTWLGRSFRGLARVIMKRRRVGDVGVGDDIIGDGDDGDVSD